MRTGAAAQAPSGGVSRPPRREGPMSQATQLEPQKGLAAAWLRIRRATRKYLNIFRASLVERMAYRGDFLLGTVLRFFPVVTTILLWEAVYRGSGQEEFAGFSRREMIAYLLLIHISRMFSSMPGLAGGIS